MGRSIGIIALCVGMMLVSASPAAAAVTHQGKVTAVGAMRISIIDNVGDLETFDVAADAKITHNGKPTELSAIDEGDVAKITLKKVDGKFVAIAVEARDME
ncbi:MAG: hypothetical protein JNM18_17465 [Planctomycetaceae bacterium]|nr:hypothetical protein [Planctomycetaceae bacterium]